MATKTQYDCQTRPNGRGGWEIAEIDAPAGMGIGNYSTEADAFAMAAYNFDRKRIKRGDEPAAAPKPVIAKQPSLGSRLVRRVKALTK
ncbi:MAG TPA: hypothetical protein VL357_03155 [Rariglobus sp.]|jgi:hypothetical protein|nr:hypothetical protein [Rariglobus sp.]